MIGTCCPHVQGGDSVTPVGVADGAVGVACGFVGVADGAVNVACGLVGVTVGAVCVAWECVVFPNVCT